MIWYRIILTSNELLKGMGKELERDFNYLFHNINQPEDMHLYRSWLIGDNHMFYYLKMPDGFGYDLGKIFSKYRTVLTFEPKIGELTLVGGISENRFVNQ